MYLGFVLSLTLSCYCAGLYLTWRRRNKFKKYKELRLLNKATDSDPSDEESSLPTTVTITETRTETTDTEDIETNVDYETETETKTETDTGNLTKKTTKTNASNH